MKKKILLKELLELDNILIDIASAIINYRIINNLSQKDLANKLKCNEFKIEEYESGDYNFTIFELFKISKKLNFKFDIIFTNNSKE